MLMTTIEDKSDMIEYVEERIEKSLRNLHVKYLSISIIECKIFIDFLHCYDLVFSSKFQIFS